MRWTSQPPDPLHFWIRLAPTSWPAVDGLWVDLARGGLGAPPKASIEIPSRWQAEPPDDVVYLPPVPAELADRLRELSSSLAEQGSPVLIQQHAGAAQESDPGSVVFDPLELLLARRLDSLEELPARAKLVWPLIPGLTDDPDQWEQGLEALVKAGAGHVQPLSLELSPADKRRLVERAGEESFHDLFHGEEPSERAFSRLASRSGFRPFLPRLLPPAGARRDNRRLAEQLAAAGELWLRLGRPESAGQSLYRSARWVEQESHNLSSLCREGNLGVIPWLDPVSAQIITELVTAGSSALLEELEDEYLGGPG